MQALFTKELGKRVGGIPWSITMHTGTVRTSRLRLVVSNSWDLEPLDLLNGLALGYYQLSP